MQLDRRIHIALASSTLIYALYRRVLCKTFLELDFSRFIIVEKQDPGPFSLSSIFGKAEISFSRIIEVINYAATDFTVVGIIARLDGLKGLGLSQIQELRSALKKFSAKGKLTVSYSATIGEFRSGALDYFLASAFDHVYIAPCGDVGMTGFYAEQAFLKNTLKHFGIEPQLEGRKEYKNFVNTFTEEKFTKEHKESTASLVTSMFEQMAEDIATSRRLTKEKVKELFTQGPFNAQQAFDHGLVDGCLYRNQVYESVEKELNLSTFYRLTYLYFDLYLTQNYRSVNQIAPIPTNFIQRIFYFNPLSWYSKVAFISLHGSIMQGPSKDGVISSDKVCSLLQRLAKDKRYSTVVIRVDSPGGSYIASDLISQEILNLKQSGRKVIVWMGDVAASGGYFISMNADKIIASPSTITGSIGVFAGKFVFRKLLHEKLKINFDSWCLENHENGKFYSYLNEFDDFGKQKLNEFLDKIYDDFVNKVSLARGLSPSRNNEFAAGKVFTGTQAHQLGLVDSLDGFDGVVTEVRKILNGRGFIFEEVPRSNWIELFKTPKNSSEETGSMRYSSCFNSSGQFGDVVRKVATQLGIPSAILESAMDGVISEFQFLNGRFNSNVFDSHLDSLIVVPKI